VQLFAARSQVCDLVLVVHAMGVPRADERHAWSAPGAAHLRGAAAGPT
jgi:hypothetical protein